MLRLYKATIIVSACIGICALGVALLCECWQIPHGTLIQNLAIGLFCSLLVVVITSMLQFKYAQKDLVREYARALWHLANQIGMAYRAGDYNFSDEFYKELFGRIDAAFERFNSYSNEIVWFSPQKQKSTKMICLYKNRMQNNYLRKCLKSDKEAVQSFSRNADYIAMLDSSIALFSGTKIGEILKAEMEFSLKETAGDDEYA